MSTRSQPLPHLLVVDDDPFVREALAAALGAQFVVHTAASGPEACAIAEAHPLAAIILDAILGDEDGVALIPRLHTLSAAPIILLTGYGTEEMAVRAFRSGAQDYVKKPLDCQTLLARLERLIPDRPPPDPIHRARRYIEGNLEKGFESSALARHLGLSVTHLRRQFRALLGMSPHRYLVEARLQRTAELLRTTDLAVERIALDVGFSTSAHFGKVFRRFFGCTPSEYRTRHTGQSRSFPSAPMIENDYI